MSSASGEAGGELEEASGAVAAAAALVIMGVTALC
jgi:hypothetical protein